MRIRSIVCSILLLCLTAYADKDNCYALILEGGGDKGAFQAGAMYEIINNFADNTVAYDIITGISVGAINGAGLSNFAQGDEVAAAEFILTLWRGLSRDTILRNWNWGGVVRGILLETSVWDSSPLENYLKDHIVPPKRDFIYGLMEMGSGKYTTFDNTEPMDRYMKGVLGSAAFPGLMKAIKDLNPGKVYLDGGVAYSLDIASAVNFCKAKGFEESQIVVDVIKCASGNFKAQDASTYTSIQHGLRYLAIRSFYGAMDIIIRARAAYQEVNFRYLVAPTTKLETGLVPFNFDPEEIEHNIQAGIRDAKASIAMGPGKSFDAIIKYANDKSSGKTEMDFGDFIAQNK